MGKPTIAPRTRCSPFASVRGHFFFLFLFLLVFSFFILIRVAFVIKNLQHSTAQEENKTKMQHVVRCCHLLVYLVLFIEALCLHDSVAKITLLLFTIASVLIEVVVLRAFGCGTSSFAHLAYVVLTWFLMPILVLLDHASDTTQWKLVVAIVIACLLSVVLALVRMYLIPSSPSTATTSDDPQHQHYNLMEDQHDLTFPLPTTTL